MANARVQPYTGPLDISLQEVGGSLRDLAPGQMSRLKREQPGIEKVTAEIAVALPAHAAAVGLSSEMLTRFQEREVLLARVRALRPAVDKAAEVLAETEALLEDEREADIGTIAVTVRKAAQRRDASLAGPFEETIRYYGQVGVRAAKTRKKNAQEGGAEAVKPKARSASRRAARPAPAPEPEAAPAAGPEPV